MMVTTMLVLNKHTSKQDKTGDVWLRRSTAYSIASYTIVAQLVVTIAMVMSRIFVLIKKQGLVSKMGICLARIKRWQWVFKYLRLVSRLSGQVSLLMTSDSFSPSRKLTGFRPTNALSKRKKNGELIYSSTNTTHIPKVPSTIMRSSRHCERYISQFPCFWATLVCCLYLSEYSSSYLFEKSRSSSRWGAVNDEDMKNESPARGRISMSSPASVRRTDGAHRATKPKYN